MDYEESEIEWHYHGKLIWGGVSPQGHDVVKDLKTGRIKRVCSLNESRALTARNGDKIRVTRDGSVVIRDEDLSR